MLMHCWRWWWWWWWFGRWCYFSCAATIDAAYADVVIVVYEVAIGVVVTAATVVAATFVVVVAPTVVDNDVVGGGVVIVDVCFVSLIGESNTQNLWKEVSTFGIIFRIHYSIYFPVEYDCNNLFSWKCVVFINNAVVISLYHACTCRKSQKMT